MRADLILMIMALGLAALGTTMDWIRPDLALPVQSIFFFSGYFLGIGQSSGNP